MRALLICVWCTRAKFVMLWSSSKNPDKAVMSLVIDTFDYVIIGGAAAGALLTNRQREDGASV